MASASRLRNGMVSRIALKDLTSNAESFASGSLVSCSVSMHNTTP